MGFHSFLARADKVEQALKQSLQIMKRLRSSQSEQPNWFTWTLLPPVCPGGTAARLLPPLFVSLFTLGLLLPDVGGAFKC